MIEIRLDATDPASLDAIFGAASIGGVRCAPGASVRRTADVVDTSDWALARARVALELRRPAGRFELVAAWDDETDGALRRRHEVRQALAARAGSPLTLPDGPVADRVRAIVAGRPLHAVLSTTLVRRRLDFPVRPRAGSVRAVTVRAFLDTLLVGPPQGVQASRIDKVVLRGALSAAPWVERLASVLARDFRLVPSRYPRTLRALMLVHGDVPFLDRASGAVATGDVLGVAARKVLALHLRRVQAHDPGTRSGGDSEELHAMRVATRRLRAALRVFAPALSAGVHERFAAGLRRLGRLLGAVRDLDVQLERSSAAPVAYARFLQGRREAAQIRLGRGLDRAPYLALLADLDRFTEGAARVETPPEALDPVGPHAAAALVRAYRRFRRAGRAAEAKATAPALHEVRIRAKRLRYALEFFAEAGGADAAGLVERLTEIQDLLGAHQDAIVGARFARAWGRVGGSEGAVAARIAVERGIAADCRQRFARAWRQFEGRETQRRLERVVRRLDPRQGLKKKGDAASGVP
jgi:CHAD domain-containing protein